MLSLSTLVKLVDEPDNSELDESDGLWTGGTGWTLSAAGMVWRVGWSGSSSWSGTLGVATAWIDWSGLAHLYGVLERLHGLSTHLLILAGIFSTYHENNKAVASQ